MVRIRLPAIPIVNFIIIQGYVIIVKHEFGNFDHVRLLRIDINFLPLFVGKPEKSAGGTGADTKLVVEIENLLVVRGAGLDR